MRIESNKDIGSAGVRVIATHAQYRKPSQMDETVRKKIFSIPNQPKLGFAALNTDEKAWGNSFFRCRLQCWRRECQQTDKIAVPTDAGQPIPIRETRGYVKCNGHIQIYRTLKEPDPCFRTGVINRPTKMTLS